MHTGSGNGLVLLGTWAITWTNVDQDLLAMYVLVNGVIIDSRGPFY